MSMHLPCSCGIHDVPHLHLLAPRACDEIMPLLIEHGGCVNDKCEIDESVLTPLQIALYSATACAKKEGKIPDKKLKTIQTLIEAGADVMQVAQARGEDEAGIPSLVISSSYRRRQKKTPSKKTAARRPAPLPPEIVHLMMNCGSFQCSSLSSSSSMKKQSVAS